MCHFSFLQGNDVRIILGQFNEEMAAKVFCCVSKRKRKKSITWSLYLPQAVRCFISGAAGLHFLWMKVHRRLVTSLYYLLYLQAEPSGNKKALPGQVANLMISASVTQKPGYCSQFQRWPRIKLSSSHTCTHREKYCCSTPSLQVNYLFRKLSTDINTLSLVLLAKTIHNDHAGWTQSSIFNVYLDNSVWELEFVQTAMTILDIRALQHNLKHEIKT